MYYAPLESSLVPGGSPVAPCPWSTRRGGGAGERGTRRGSSRPPPSRAWCPGGNEGPRFARLPRCAVCAVIKVQELAERTRARGVLWFSLVPACLQRAGCGIGQWSRLLCGRGGRARIGGTALELSSISRLAANCNGQISAIARKRQGLAVRPAASQRAIGGAKALPSHCHMDLVALYRHGRIHHVITTNTDGLHWRSGIPPEALTTLQGNPYIEACGDCGHQYLRDFMVRDLAICQGTCVIDRGAVISTAGSARAPNAKVFCRAADFSST